MKTGEKRETVLTTKSQFKGKEMQEGKQEAVEKVIEVREFGTAPAQVMVEYGLTINLGNYESARVAVSLSLPCYAEEVEDAYEFATKFVEKKVQEQLDQIKGSSARSVI